MKFTMTGARASERSTSYFENAAGRFVCQVATASVSPRFGETTMATKQSQRARVRQ
jgi:hypothetical protein